MENDKNWGDFKNLIQEMVHSGQRLRDNIDKALWMNSLVVGHHPKCDYETNLFELGWATEEMKTIINRLRKVGKEKIHDNSK